MTDPTFWLAITAVVLWVLAIAPAAWALIVTAGLRRDVAEAGKQIAAVEWMREEVARMRHNLKSQQDELRDLERRIDAIVDSLIERRNEVEIMGSSQLSTVSEPASLEIADAATIATAPAVSVDRQSLSLQFLRECEDRTHDVETATRWFSIRLPGSRVELLQGSSQHDWALLRLVDGDLAVVLPAIRRPMGDCPLADYYELSHFNGVDIVKARFVRRLATETAGDGTWTLAEKGRIDGD